jgi:hypothetical protein
VVNAQLVSSQLVHVPSVFFQGPRVIHPASLRPRYLLTRTLLADRLSIFTISTSNFYAIISALYYQPHFWGTTNSALRIRMRIYLLDTVTSSPESLPATPPPQHTQAVVTPVGV